MFIALISYKIQIKVKEFAEFNNNIQYSMHLNDKDSDQRINNK